MLSVFAHCTDQILIRAIISARRNSNASEGLGADLRTARLRRNTTLAEVAERIGASREVVGEAERGKLSTSVAVYAALLWSYGLVDRLGAIADPTTDKEGQRLASLRERRHARAPQPLDDDF